MAPTDRAPTASGRDRLVTSGVSCVLAGLSGGLAHTMALCGLGELRSVPRDPVTRPT